MKTIVIAPHPDDEVLGCGGIILKRLSENHEVAWLLMTDASKSPDFNKKTVLKIKNNINKVIKNLGIKKNNFYQLEFLPSRLDTYPLQDIIVKINKVFLSFLPNEVLVPHYGDIHSDHRVTFDAIMSASKSFRYPFVKKILCYETISETDFNLHPEKVFFPNYYVDITKFFKKKLETLNLYDTEMGQHPFPRSTTNVKALATKRGSQANFNFAEAFVLLKEIED